MSFLEVLQECRDAGVRIAVRDGKLLVADAQSRLSPDLRRRLGEHKSAILAYLDASIAAPTRIAHHADADEHPLSFAQRRLWFLHQLDRDGAEYNLSLSLRARGALDVAALRAAFDAIVSRHAVLRTSFEQRDGEPVQVVHPHRPLPIDLRDLSALAADAQEREVLRLAQEEARAPFDLTRAPILRCGLLRLADDHHAILLTLHHIATDGWSMGVLVREFMAHYAAAVAGGTAALPPLAIQYGDYARWQQAERDGGVLHESLRYWTERLAGLPAVHALPLDRPRPPRQRFAAQRHVQLLDRATLDAANRFAKASGATLFMVLQSAFAHLIARWSGQHDVVIGTPTAGREQPETAPLIGFFNNTVLCRFEVPEGADARALVAHGRSVALDAFTHQHVPFDLLVETFSPARSLAYNPLCQIKFVLQNHDGGALELPGLRFEPLLPGGEHVHFDLDLTATEGEDGLHLAWTFKDELFEGASIQRMAAAYAHLLRGMCAHPDVPLDEIGLVDDAQADALRALGRGEVSSAGRASTVVRGFEAAASAFPDRIAARCDGVAIGYRDLDVRANRLAHVLIEQSVAPGDRVGVHLGRSIELLIGLLAVLKAGAAYVPLDVRRSAQQLHRIVADSAMRVALHHGATPLQAAGIDTVFLDGAAEDADWLGDYPATAPAVDVGMDDSAYVLYTSGSTGVPKGVDVLHRGMVDYCAFARESYYTAALTGSIVATSPAFDLTLPALFVPLLAGDCVELLTEHDDLSTLAARLAAADCSDRLLRLTPSHVQGLLHLLDATPLPQAHAFVVGGERFPPELARALRARFPQARLYNHYGPTETVVGCSWYDLGADLDRLQHTVPIGRPMHNTSLYVLDAALRPVPPGVIGELCIGGAGVARGYLGQPALTAERFVDDPWQPGERLYRSGDRVRWRADGQLEFVGRNDDQIKLRGFRIELGEIEHHLGAAAGVRRAAAQLVGEGDDARSAGDVEPALDTARMTALRAALAVALPAHLLPAAIVTLDALPMTVNGKVDRNALPAPAFDDDAAADAEAPATVTEERLAALWRHVLKRETIDRNANFFAIGGHSLLATRLVGEVARAFGKPLQVRAVFEHATLRALAAYLDTQSRQAQAGIARADRGAPLPLSFAQQRLWFLDRLEGGSAQFNMPSALRLSGPFEPDALRRALDALVERHEILRTVYAEHDGTPVQIVRPAPPISIQLHDLRELDDAAREPRIQALRREEALRPFDLARDPVLRCALLRVRDDETVVLLTVHHIACDGWSNDVLARELVAFYDGFRAGRDVALAPLPVQYADYAAWQRGRLRGDALQTELDYWRQRLAGIPWVHSLPLDHPRPAQQDFAGRVHVQILGAADTAAARAFCERRGVTLFVLARALFAMLIGRASREHDIVIGTPVAGRVHRDLEGLIGLFINTLVLRTDLEDNPTFDALVERCRADSLEAYAHQEMPFETLVDELKPTRSLSYNPLVQILLNVFESVGDAAVALAGAEASAVRSDTPEALSKADLTLYVRAVGDQLLLKWSYRASLFDDATIRRFADGFGELLRQAVAAPDARILDYALLSDTDQQAQLAHAVPRARDYGDDCLHERVHAAAAAAPDAIALIHRDRRIAYGELAVRARALAATLHARGVAAGDTVAILAERGVDYATAVLACLDAGAIYLPLAADLPQARIAYMLRDAAVRLLLVQPALRGLVDASIETLVLDGAETAAEAAEAVAAPPPTLPARTLADASHLLFTSGSTGEPKSVVGTHGALVNRVAWMHEAFPFDDDEVCCLITSIAFVRAVWELAVPLAAGRPVLIVDPDTVQDLEAFARLLAEHCVTRIVTAPSLARALTDLPDAAALLSGLRYWFVSGEPLRAGVAARIRAVLPDAVLCNLYGSTETMSDVSFEVVESGEGGAIPIGRAIANSALLILDEHLRPVPTGIPGEICAAGANLAQGYRGRTALTDEKFARHRLGTAFGERVYRTGDLGRVLEDGRIECLGRLDYQVKVRGFRIELGEIEMRLLRSARVQDAAVLVKGQGDDARLVAYVVPRACGDGLVEALRSELRGWLPDYMQPAAYVVLDGFPLTANGKVDRRALPEPAHASADHMPPSTPTEIVIAEVWRELLKLDRVGAGDNFFEVGGHSLLATRMASALSARTGKPLSVRTVFETPVLADIARRIDAETRVADAPIPRVPRAGGVALSLAQQRLWFVSRFEGGGAQYNLPTAMRIAGALDVATLQRALDALVARHEVLRTTYAERDGQALQIVHPARPVAIARLDLSGFEADARTRELERLSREEPRRPFDLSLDPSLRCTLIALAPQEHALLFTVHHIASDGWSKGLLVREFVALYGAALAGTDAGLPELAVQYADYAAWQRSPEQTAAIARDLDYWKTQLAHLPQVHALPLDRPRPARQDYRAARVLRRLDRDGLERLRRLALDHDATLFMVLQAALALLIGRWSGETDVVIGSPVAGRTRRELEPLIGFFINSLVLRTDFSDDPDFATLLARSRRTVLDAFAHQGASFDMLVETLRPERHLSHGPLFQVVFALQNHERSVLSLPGLDIEALSNDAHSIDLDLHLAGTEDEHGMHFRWLYATSLFDAATVERLADSYLALLAAIADAPEAPVSTLPLLPARDRAAIAQWSAAPARPLPRTGAHALFEAHAAATPDAVAATCEGDAITYGALNAAANRVAHWLRAEGVGPGHCVGLCVERSLDMAVGLLGILKSGAAYLPLDPGYPQERVEAMLADGAVEHVLAHTSVVESLPFLAERTLLPMDAAIRASLLAALPDTDPDPDTSSAGSGFDPDQAAYAVFTSGSTGVPKGVLNTHRGLVNLALYQRDALDAGPGSRVLGFGSISFDGGVFDWLLALAHGGSLHICSEDDRHSVEKLSALLTRERITHAAIPPALLAQVPLDRDYALRVLVVAGEACDEALAWRWAAHCRVVNSYGPSEAAVAATHADVVPGERITLGHALPNVELHVLNARGQAQPIGVAGELRLGGAGLALGYLRQPALTAQRFEPHPADPARRLYRTGDRVHWLPDGRLQFLGRVDDQVKLRGFRIELGEVEQRLLAHPQVREAVAIVREDGGDRRLVAYVVAMPSADAAPHPGPHWTRELREHLRALVPDYMLPAAIVVLGALPLGRNGKIDKARLPQPDYALEQDFVAPAGDTEQRLAAIWQRVLQLDRIGADTNFFEIGGHSLLATQVISHVAEEFGRDIAIRSLFERPTIAGLARCIDEAVAHDVARIVPVARDRAPPLSFSQQRLWFIDRLGGGSAQYNMRFGVRLAGELDTDAVQRAIDAVVARHEVLRTTFATHDGESVQVVHPAGPQTIARHDLLELPPEEREAALGRIVRADAASVFDLTTDPMLRCTLVRLQEHEHALVFSTHHIASDGWSMNLLGREFVALYGAFRDGVEPALPALDVQYADYAWWQRTALRGEALEAQLAHWRGALAGLPPVHGLRLDKPRPAVQKFDGDHVARRLDAATLQGLKALALAQEASLFMVLQAAVAVLIGRWSGETDIVIGTPVAGRTQKRLEPLIGFFINSLALRTDLSGDPDFVEVLRRARRSALDAYANQDVPFEMLVETLRPERTLSHSPLYQISFTFHNHEQDALVLPGLELSPLRSEGQQSRYDIELHMTESDAGVHVRWVYATSLFERSTIERMADGFETLVGHLLEDPRRPVHALPIASPDTASQLLAYGIRHEAPAQDVCAHRLFEDWARRTPTAIALVFEDEALDYAALNREANRVAHFLRAQGVGADVLVGLCVDRSLEMIIGLLGILKAGGAYVPLDPTYPEARLAQMLEDSGVEIVLTQNDVLEALPMLGERVVLPLDPAFRAVLLADQPEHDPAPEAAGIGPGSLAYVIYTSGSTGEPKGVMLEHRGLTNLAHAQARHFDIGPGDRVLQFSSLNFDASTWDWLLALAHGATLYVCPQDTRLATDRLADYLVGRGITHALIPPAMLAHVDSARDYALRVLTVGGEACDEALAWRWARKCRVVNAYGPSENTVVTTFGDVVPDRPVTLGTALANCGVAVVNAHRCLAPVGVPGELLVGGASLARGYLRREALTAERFVANRIDPRLGERLYRTGDLVRWREDGQLEFLGRSDDQVKLRGFRIELGEIEAALLVEAAVAEAAVVIRNLRDGDEKRLVAYVVPRDGVVEPARAGALAAELRSALKRRLPEYMVPAACVVLAALPLLPSGKLDRSALSAPEAYASAEHVDPETPTERAIAAAWAELLELDVASIGANAGFFDLGGHSILAIRLVSQLGGLFGVDLNVRDLFHHPSLAELARHIDDVARRGGGEWTPLVALDATPGVPVLYAFPAAGLTAFSYRPLAQALKGRLALQVLDPRGADGRRAPCLTMQEMVDTNLRALLAQQPQGPYLIAGHSFGGAVAFEVARELERAGHEVRLALIDSILYLREAERATHSVSGYLRRLLQADDDNAPPAQAADEDEALRAFFARRMQRQGLAADAHGDALRGMVDVFRAQLDVYGRYRPEGRFGGPVLSILARDGHIARIGSAGLAAHYAAGVAGDVELSIADGGHLSLLSTQHAPALADRLAHLAPLREPSGLPA